MKKEKVFYNAKIVLEKECLQGTIVLKDGKIKEITEDTICKQTGVDCNGDYLIPGLIELHTDNLEKYIVPRPGILWPSPSASIIAHDNQVIGAGITTVLDAIALGFDDSKDTRFKILDKSIQALDYTRKNKLLRADHLIHLRCELPSSTVYDSFLEYADHPHLKLISLMDHTPGQRQWRNIEKWKTFHKSHNWSEKEINRVLNNRKELQKKYSEENLTKIISLAKDKKIPFASHDDTTEQHSVDSSKHGIHISEFPTTLEAAKKAKELGMVTIMGSPNMVRGESHSGNISAEELARNGYLDGLSSDYMPISLLHGSFEIHHRLQVSLPESIAMTTANIANMLNLEDRGTLAAGKIADIIQVQIFEDFPVIKRVVKSGRIVHQI